MERKLRICVIGALMLAIAPATASFAADAPARVQLLTSPIGTGSYVFGTALEKISKDANAGVIVNSSESPGFLYNIKKLDRDQAAQKNTVVGSGSGLLSLATNGRAPFKKKYKSLKLIANYEVEGTWLATLDPSIKTVKDLVGKRVALGRSAQINWTIEPREIFEHGWDIPLNKLHIQYVGIKEAVDALLNGTADAAIVGGYFNPAEGKVVPSPQTLELLSSGRSIHFIPWGKEFVEKTAKHGVAIRPYTLPAGSVEGLKQPLEIFADNTAWMVAADFPEKNAYELTKLIIANSSKFGKFTALGKLLTKELLTSGWKTTDIAPGALRAYKEAGLIK
ncbi:MAG TPA: TAXI family TRAP transporter solute-binding subunit [Sphingomicrobium sp.]|nr:TAXI family TRAP transporter solute-binding subunit [Sphingomicrobium sp.]